MAFEDWNNDGKKDIQDDFMEYNIYQESTKDEQGGGYNRYQSRGNFGCLGMVVVVALLIFAVHLFTKCTTSYCSVKGCDKECTEGSSYCYIHDASLREYGSPTYFEDKDRFEHEPNKPQQAYEPQAESSAPAEVPAKNEPTYPSEDDGSHKINDDPYNAKDYYDAEDFYEDYYDDFWDFEEAEEYYNEHCDR